MATKKSSANAKAAVEHEVSVSASLTPEQLEKLPANEQKAVEEIDSYPTGTGKIYKLADETTQYTELETGWTLAGDQAKTLPEGYTAETIQRIKDGFLVETDTANEGLVPPGQVAAAGTEEAEQRAKAQSSEKGSEKGSK